MAQTQVRVVGSGFTTLNYRGHPLAYLESFVDSGQSSSAGQTGRGWEAIHPLGSRHPVEIATGRYLDAGTLDITVKELWNEPVWYQMLGLRGKRDIVDVWEAIAATPVEQLTATMLIRPPGGGRARGKTYIGLTVVNIPSGENVTLGALSMSRTVEMVYTHTKTL